MYQTTHVTHTLPTASSLVCDRVSRARLGDDDTADANGDADEDAAEDASILHKVGCRTKWDRWSSKEMPHCSTLKEFR